VAGFDADDGPLFGLTTDARDSARWVGCGVITDVGAATEGAGGVAIFRMTRFFTAGADGAATGSTAGLLDVPDVCAVCAGCAA